MRKYLSSLISLLFVVVFSACSGGDGGDGGDSSAPTTSTVTGIFIDDLVQGLDYSCSSAIGGKTNSSGEYTCNVGDTVSFDINGWGIGGPNGGSIAAESGIITPYSLFPHDIQQALNLARLLQTLDTDGNTTNGLIVLDTSIITSESLPHGLNLDGAVEPFDTYIEDALNITLISEVDAEANLNASIIDAGGSVPNGSIPISNAGVDQNIDIYTAGTLVALDGSGSSDADGDVIAYIWSIVSKPSNSSAILSDTTIVNPTFTADEDGIYTVQLVVDDQNNTSSDTVVINITNSSAAPISRAGVDQNVLTTSLVTLDGSGSSDANSDTLTYSWTVESKPLGSSATLSETTIVDPMFTADVDGAYVFSLVVNDGTVDSVSDTVIINATTESKWDIVNWNEFNWN